jgi:hypothetical protein
MALGRLEFGEIETTTYKCPSSGEDVKVCFRHPTDGEKARALADAGIDFDGAGDDTQLVDALDGTALASTEMAARMEQAHINVAKACITSPSMEGLYKPAVVAIGQYLFDAASVSKEEGEH